MSRLVIAIHDVVPRRLEAARAWRRLVERQIGGPVSLLVVPRYGGRDAWDGTEGLAWLRSRASEGDEIVVHGLSHTTTSGRDGAELAKRHPDDVFRRVVEGTRELSRVGLCGTGFIAPAYVHPVPARTACNLAGLAWWATRWRLEWDGEGCWLPSISLGASTRGRRLWSPPFARVAVLAAVSWENVRLDLHTADLDHPALTAAGLSALHALLEQGRTLVTHSQLMAASSGAVGAAAQLPTGSAAAG